MSVKVWSLTARGAVAVSMGALVLTGCGNEAAPGAPETPFPAATPSETTSGTPESSRSSRTAAPVDSLDELFEAVDDRFDCPSPSDGFSGQDHFFMVDGGERLVGRQCGETIVMAWSEDRALIQGARELLSSAVEPVPVVGTAEWFVADITEAGEGGTGATDHQAASKDLDRLAAELGADVDEG
ncbi:hypothetical protein GCM10010977_26620 [Citricoccus zhacaiensis]|uniref:DUF3558 domain-containing protein n=1 Tax=Citricoccus zhacaiensis TaxID=489142 RepID=A0ABQ2M7Y9_9MICC|nr:hypothetical protein [Citricoccus zhacaiensis]GGO48016.1 hypothetical protein GCM10010977_26620 [Citricoccus zhacaiensis]